MAKKKLFESYLAIASSLIQQYNGAVPLNNFLKQYFSLHKKFGSRDRNYITELCYCYYRMGQNPPRSLKGELLNFDENIIRQRIITGLFLCSEEPNELLAHLKEEWNEKTLLPVNEKVALISYSFSQQHIFPCKDELSKDIDATAFATSHLIQPDLFLRTRPDRKQQVLKKLQEHKIECKECSDNCLALPNTTKIENVLEINKEVVIQDYSSQRIQEFLQIAKSEIRNLPAGRQGLKSEIKVWDCCAASGGKSILTVDVFKNIDLTVSDIRPSIITNLKRRFKEAGIKNYNSQVVDLTQPVAKTLPLTNGEGFNLIICDAPCTGSGTWSRTPEQLYFFDKEKINYYSNLQKKIVSNTISHLAKNGFFLYITCSVFKKENEEVVEFIQKNFKLQLVKQEILIGYKKKADTMFAALLKKVDNP
ncbi:MAG TPA: Fmu (Sun) domain-containing protein [Chitinophagaceae bacterium]|jgi:16S rRNA (cytosine967-C5)-methyltransferase